MDKRYFEGPFADKEATAVAATLFGSVIEHEGTLFTVVYDPATKAAPNVGNDTVAAAIAAARTRKA